jgi:pimeloyl-ACP methyl ester carboxylesterase
VPTATCNGIDIYYERSGTGPRLLFFNGSGATLAGTGFVLKPFAERFDLLAHDQRGLGKTSKPPGPYSMADYATDALALLDVIGWDTCRVVGISFGGMVAQEFAVTAPERVERLALVCTSAGGAAGASYPLHELEALPADERAAIGTTIMDTRFTPEWLADPEHAFDRALVAARNAAAPVDDDDVRRGAHEQLQARRYHDVADRLHRITCPTLVSCGRYDGIAPPANSKAIASRIDGADLRFYEGGHMFFAQDRQAIPDVLDFLAAD